MMLNENFNNSIPFLSGYKQLKIPIMDNAGNPAWPEMFPTEKIQDLENIVGHRHFSSQMMLEYVAQERIHLDPGAVHFYSDDFNAHFASIGENHITGYCFYWDPSSGAKQHDGSVCALIYRDDKTRNVFVHDVLYMVADDEDIHPLANQCETVLRFMQQHNLTRIGIEINGIGNALPEIMRNIAATLHIPVNIIKISNHIKKETRILNAFEPVLSTGHLYMHTRINQTILLSEMLAWTPIGSKEHDDGLDAVAGALAMVPVPLRPHGNNFQTMRANTEFKI